MAKMIAYNCLRHTPAFIYDQIGAGSFPYPITAILRSSRGFAILRSAPAGAKHVVYAPLRSVPVRCPPVQARRTPDRRIAQKEPAQTVCTGSFCIFIMLI